MATRRQKAKVGLFVLICALLITGGILLIAGIKGEPMVRYWIEFDESVLGLSSGGLVEYLGVPVGKVDDIVVTNENKPHVDIVVSAKKVTLREGVTAQLVIYSFATGTMCVSLRGGPTTAPPKAPGSQITNEKSLVEAVSTQISGILDKTTEVMETVKNGLVGMETGDLSAAIQDADALMAQGQEILSKAGDTLEDLRGQADSRLEDFDKLAKDVKKLVEDTDTAIVKATKKIETLQLGKTEENLNTMLKNIADLTKRLQESANAIDTVSRRATHEADNIEYSIRATLRTMNESVEAARKLMEYLQQDPSALLRGKGKSKGVK